MSRASSLFVLLACVACGEPDAPARPAPALETPAPPAAPSSAPPTPTEPASSAPTEPAAPTILYGDVVELSRERWNGGPRTILVEAPSQPAPSGPVVAYAETHHSYWAFRWIEDVSVPSPTAVVVSTYPAVTVCDVPLVRARRLHATSMYEESDGTEVASGERTFLALELGRGCPGGDLAVVGVPLAAVAARDLDRGSVTEPSTLELADLIREEDDAYGGRVPAADVRVLPLPAHDVTLVRGALTFLVRDGLLLRERFGGNPSVMVDAGSRLFFWVESPSDSWSAPLECFHPTYDAGSCEVIDESGTPTNVRGGPSGRSAVVATLSRGATVAADDHVGSWFRVRTTPPGWVHESGVRCTELPLHAAPCP